MTKPEEVIHDRQADVLPQQRAGVVVDVVDNPYGLGKISVTRSTRDDPLAGMRSRGFIDAAQYAAGRRWQQCWEDSEIGSVRAIDPTKEPVDGKGPARAPFTDRQREAFRELQTAALVLGYQGDAIVRAILAQRMQIAALAQSAQRPKKYMGQRFRECLEALAKLWRYA